MDNDKDENDWNDKFNRQTGLKFKEEDSDYINVLPSIETAATETKKTPGNKCLNSKGKKAYEIINELETVVSSKNNLISMLPSSNNIYDSDRGENIEHGMNEKYTLHKDDSKSKDKGQEQNNFPMWRLTRIAAPNIYEEEEETGTDSKGASICKQAELPETSKAGLLKSTSTKQEQGELSTVSKSITILPDIYERVADTGINIDISICEEPEIPEPSTVEVIRRKLRRKHILIGAFICMAVMIIAGICFMAYYSTLSNTKNSRENPTASNGVATTTTDVAVTTNTAVVVTNDVAVTSYNVTLTTKNVAMTSTDVAVSTFNVVKTINNVVMTISNVAVTTNDVECLNFETKCIRFKRKITDNKIARDELVRASGSGNIMLVCELLKCGVSAISRDKKGHSPLRRAAEKGHVKVAQLLLTYNASVDNGRGYSPLHFASKEGHTEVVKLLLTYYASVDQTLPIGHFPPLYLASAMGHTDVVKLLLKYNASVNKSAIDGLTPLHAAVWENREAIVELLCNAGADVIAQTGRYIRSYIASGSTPLHMAVFKRNTRIVKTLILHKSELLKDSNGFTALDISRQQNSSDITEVLEGREIWG